MTILAVQTMPAIWTGSDSRSSLNRLEQDTHNGGRRSMEETTFWALIRFVHMIVRQAFPEHKSEPTWVTLRGYNCDAMSVRQCSILCLTLMLVYQLQSSAK